MSSEEEKKEINEPDNNIAPIADESQPQKKEREIVETIDVAEVDATLKENKDFVKQREDNSILIIKKVDENKISNKEISYLADININAKCRYIGFLTRNLKRMGRGFNLYNNNKYDGTANDEYYYGEWNFIKKEDDSEIRIKEINKESEKNGFGIYHYKNNDENIDSELYIGNWENGLKKGNGIYIWNKKGDESQNKYYDCIIGDFGGNGLETLNKGMRLQVFKDERISSSDKTVRIAYLSDMNENGVKNDDKCIIIENDKIFKGEVKEDEIKKGRFVCTKKENSKSIKQKSYNILMKVKNPDEDTEEKFDFNAEKNDEVDDFLLKLKNSFDDNKFYDEVGNFIEKVNSIIQEAQKMEHYANGEFNDEKNMKDSIDEFVKNVLNFIDDFHDN